MLSTGFPAYEEPGESLTKQAFDVFGDVGQTVWTSGVPRVSVEAARRVNQNPAPGKGPSQ